MTPKPLPQFHPDDNITKKSLHHERGPPNWGASGCWHLYGLGRRGHLRAGKGSHQLPLQHQARPRRTKPRRHLQLPLLPPPQQGQFCAAGTGKQDLQMPAASAAPRRARAGCADPPSRMAAPAVSPAVDALRMASATDSECQCRGPADAERQDSAGKGRDEARGTGGRVDSAAQGSGSLHRRTQMKAAPWDAPPPAAFIGASVPPPVSLETVGVCGAPPSPPW
ncbi:uncharacterized protein LOC121821997 [Peromyscus maniculatus bairdii]|uniref:uncharacterized protein LOC121821997 n=1 Tax=Peromyscus maniculatus bairdii TaxID=230844 RepID=UPI003FD2F0D3